MRVLQVVTLISPDGAYGGPVAVARNMSKALTDLSGHEVVLAAGVRGDGVALREADDCHVVFFSSHRMIPRSGFAGLAAPRMLLWLMRHGRDFDVAHVHMGRDLTSLPAAALLQRMGIPTVLQTHGMIDRSGRLSARILDILVTRRTLRSADAVLYLTEHERLELVGALGVNPETLRLVENGVPLGPANSYQESLEVLFISRLEERKQPLHFVQAAEIILPTTEGWKFVLAGPDEGEARAITAEISRIGSDRIELLPAIAPAEVSTRLRSAAFLVLPSRDEPFPMIVLEAMAQGLPVIVTDSCGLAPAIEALQAGRVTDGTVNGLAAAMAALTRDGSERVRLGENARNAIKKEFSVSRIARTLSHIYASVLSVRAQPEGAQKPSVVWLTNFSPPYRRPVWEHLSSAISLEVLLLDREDSAEGSARPRDWFEEDEVEQGYGIHYVPTRRWTIGGRLFLVLPWATLRRIRKADIILFGGWEQPAYWQTLALGLLLRKRRVGFYESTVHDQMYTSGPISIARSAFYRALHAVVVPGLAAQDSVARMKVRTTKIYRGFNSINTHRFARPAAPPSGARRGHNFVYVGQLIERKNVVALLGAFERIHADGDVLTIIGDGPERARLEQFAFERGISTLVFFLGSMPGEDIATTLRSHHTLVLPSLQEVWGLVVNEALTAGLHSVVSDYAGVARDVAGMPGVYLASPTVEGLAAAMQRSRSDWSGPIESPPILSATPRAFAETFSSAFGIAAPDDRDL